MQLKNINIILAFATLALKVLSSPIYSDDTSITLKSNNLGSINFNSEATIQTKKLFVRDHDETEVDDAEDVETSSDSDNDTAEVAVSDNESTENPEDSEYDDEVTVVETEAVTEYVTEVSTEKENDDFEGEDYVAKWDYTAEEILQLVEKIKKE